MKSIKAIFTVLLCIAIICVISASELLYCMHSTLMSTSHFTKFLDKDRNLTKLTTLVYSSLTEPPTDSSNQAASKYAFDILNKLDKAWVKGQLYIGASGLQKYMVSDTTTLPTLDFMPLNTVIKETLISEVMKQPTTQESIGKVKTVLSVLNTKYFSTLIKYGISKQLVPALQKLAAIQSTGFTSSTMLAIIDIYLSFSNETITLDQASNNIALKLVERSLELDKLKDYFDMDLFLEKAFNSSNPVLAVRTFIHDVNASISLLVKLLFWVLILLIFINSRFSLIRFLRIILYCVSMATIFNLLLSVLFINPVFSQNLISAFSAPQDRLGEFLIKLWVFFFKDFGFYLALQSILIGFFAVIAYLIVIALLKKSTKPMTSNPKTLTGKSFVRRFTVALVVLILLFCWWNMYSINKEIKLLQSNIKKLSNVDINQSIMNGLKEAGGMEFLDYIQKK